MGFAEVGMGRIKSLLRMSPKAAGVSQATVSMVLNKSIMSHFSKETVEKGGAGGSETGL